MLAPLNPLEIYLLEQYVSVAYFGDMRDLWEKMVKHVDYCLNAFMKNLPADYRSRKLPEQPDVVWGSRVLPNFRRTLESLNVGFVLLTHGDVKALAYANGPLNDNKGRMDYWSGWMTQMDEEIYEDLIGKAAFHAHKIVLTEGAYWSPCIPIEYCLSGKDALRIPQRLPVYRIDRATSVRSGEKVKKSGIYTPDVESGPQFLSVAYDAAPPASVSVGSKDCFHPITGEKIGVDPAFEKRPCTWYLVIRDEDRYIENPLESPNARELRVRGGEPCPEAGFYFTPARQDSRTYFDKDEVLPRFDALYGETIWQWDSLQS